MEVAAIGRTEMLYNTIREIDRSEYNLNIIITSEAEDFYETDEEDFRELADELGVDFVRNSKINSEEIVEDLRTREIDVAVSVNWKTLIRKEVLNSFEHGILNYHGGDLPRYRGNAAMNWAMIQGEEKVVHTIHRMVEKLDAGPIYVQEESELTHDTYLFDVYEDARREVPDMFLQSIDMIQNGVSPTPQSKNPQDALRCYPRKPKDSEVDWEDSAEQIHRLVRASAEPLFGAFTYYEGERLTIWRSRVEKRDTPYLGTPGQVAELRPSSGEVVVVTGDGFLVLEEIEIGGGGRQNPTDIIDSHRDRLGMDITGSIVEMRDEE